LLNPRNVFSRQHSAREKYNERFNQHRWPVDHINERKTIGEVVGELITVLLNGIENFLAIRLGRNEIP